MEMLNKLDVFDIGSLQNAKTLLSLFKDIDDANKAIAQEINDRISKKETKYENKYPLCQECKISNLDCMPINTGQKCRNVGGKFKSLIFCTNINCSFSEYSSEDCK